MHRFIFVLESSSGALLMTAVDVDKQNFSYWVHRIKKSIEDAALVSFDCEFLGLPSAINECASSLFDTPSVRYRKLRDAVCRFPPCQLGLVCYQEGDEGATYRADAFCITLFKRIPPKEFSISTSAVNFLAEHKFDFNKFVSYGVNYCNHRELADLKSQITSGNIDLELLGTDFEDRMRLIKMRILLEIEERDVSDCHSSVSRTETQLRRPLIINLYHGEVEDFDQGDAVWDRPVSPLEEAVMLYSLYEEYPDLEFQLDCERSLEYPLAPKGNRKDAVESQNSTARA